MLGISLPGLLLGVTGGGGEAPSYSETYEATYINDGFLPRPSSMPLNWGQGVYWIRIVDMRNFDAFPGDWAIYYTTNHSPSSSAESGVWLMIGRGGNARTADWKDYDVALADGWLDDLPVKPAGNPIIYSADPVQNAAGFTQLETFSPIIIGDEIISSMQASNITGYRYNQATFLLPPSSDGVNFTLPATRSAAWLQNPTTGVVGNGHTGYASIQLNPFSTIINPSTGLPWVYLITSLAGGTDRGANAWWGADVIDPAVLPTLLRGIHPDVGIICDEPTAFNNRRTSPPASGTWRSIGGGNWSGISSYSTAGSGSDIIYSLIGERFIGPEGRSYRGKSKVVLPRDLILRPGGPQIQSVVYDTVNQEWVALYLYRDADERTVGGMMAGPLRDPRYTVRDPTVPDMSSITIAPQSLISAPLPSGFSSSTRGTPSGNATQSANGFTLQVTAGATGDSEASIFHDTGFIPNEYDMIDIWFDDVSEGHSNLATRRLAFGFAGSAHVGLESITRGIFVANYNATGNGTANGGTANGSTAWMHRLADGTDAVTEAIYYAGLGLDGTNALFKRSFGVRIYPRQERAFFLSYNGAEFALFGDLSSFDWSQRLYPFFTARTSDTSGSANSYTRIPGMDHNFLLATTPVPILDDAIAYPTVADPFIAAVTTSRDNGDLYWVVTTSSTAPTPTQVKAGEDATGAAAVSSGSQPVSATGVQSVTGTGSLTAGAEYYIHFVQDGTGGDTNVATSLAWNAMTTEAGAYIARMTVAPPGDWQGLLNTFFKTIIDAGVYAKMRQFAITAAHDTQAKFLNGLSTSFTITEFGTTSFTPYHGVAGDGVTGGFSLNWTPSTDGVVGLNDIEIGCYINGGSNAASDTGTVMGATTTGAGGLLICPRSASDTLRGRANASTTVNFTGVSSTNRRGLFSIRRTSSSAQKMYRGSTASNTNTNASNALPTFPVYFGCINVNGTATNFVDNQFAFVYAAKSLTDADKAELNLALIALFTPNGAN